VSERKRIQIVDYRGSKALTTSNIEDELKKRDVALRIDTFYDLAKARRGEAVVKEKLHAQGRPLSPGENAAETGGGAGMQVSFIINDGPQAKVKEIDFTGNNVFSDSKLRGQMKKIKPSGFWNLSWLGGKSTYTPDKWLGNAEDHEGDQGRLNNFYLDHGYVTAAIGEPKITDMDDNGSTEKKPKKGTKTQI